jgi:hypothetical protein
MKRILLPLLLLMAMLSSCEKETPAPNGVALAAAAAKNSVGTESLPPDPGPDPYGPVIRIEIGVFYPDGQPVANHPVKTEKLNCEYDFTPAATYVYTTTTGSTSISGSKGSWQFWAWNSGHNSSLDYACIAVAAEGQYQVYLTIPRPQP